jgi:hypothetical protein
MRLHFPFAYSLLLGCSTSGPTSGPGTGSPTNDSGPTLSDSGAVQDAGPSSTDGGGTDSGGKTDGGSRDAGPYMQRYGDGGANAPCELNRECARGLRCECTAGNCGCKTGVRGNGGIGAPCSTGEDCGSSICINDMICSDECTNVSECKPAFTKCLVGPFMAAKICAP